ncbi:MAG: hypothetical protein IT384_13970 [Deltaproteobacteria bacterium]|nr:hypothetical protein [Deltaproteobacteria bacterium]
MSLQPRVGLVECLAPPEPDADRALLCDAVSREGVAAEWVAWNDPDVDWSRFRRLVIRATWDYYRHLDAFLRWVDARGARLANPADIVRWNAHKSYLNELEAEGVPTVPTEIVRRAGGTSVAEICGRRGWDRVVIKPAVSAGSFQTRRFETHQREEAEDFLARAERDMMVQPYVPSVEGSGERSLIWIDGAFTHAMRKTARFSGDPERVEGPLPIAEDELEVAGRALAPREARLLYGRVDLARDRADRPMVMELELIEPSLFLAQHPPALERLAKAIKKRALTT